MRTIIYAFCIFVIVASIYIGCGDGKQNCTIKIPNHPGEFCQKRDPRGNIYYITADGETMMVIY